MISLLLLLLTLVLSAIVVRIGAIALELTGLPEEQASFQSLSSFSGVGYTTREAEFVLSHPRRRRIIKTLIVLGSAGIVTTVATLGGTVVSSGSIMTSMTSRPLAPWLPLNLSQVILLAAIGMLFVLYKSFYTPSLSRLTKEIISVGLLKGRMVQATGMQEVLLTGGGYGVFRVDITPTHPLAGSTLGETRLRESEITVLSINRLSESMEYPAPETIIQVGDVVTVFGPVAAIRDQCSDSAIAKDASEPAADPHDATLPLMSLAPPIALKNQHGRTIKLTDYDGRKNLIIAFYPKDQSFICSRQLAEYSEHLNTIHGLDTEVLAINPESEKSHANFCDASNLQFPVLSDSKKTVCRAYRALMLGGLIVDRTVYIIDKHGLIRYAKRGRPSLSELLRTLLTINQSSITR